MVCVHCGGELSVGARFCSHCGVAVLMPPGGSEMPHDAFVMPPAGSEAPPDAFVMAPDAALTFSALVTTRWRLVLPDGTTVPVDGPLLIGRRPDATRGPHGARLLVVEDPRRTVSRSHLVLAPAAGGGVLATDVSGRHGIVVTGQDGSERRVTGASIELTAPCRIGLGAMNAWLRLA